MCLAVWGHRHTCRYGYLAHEFVPSGCACIGEHTKGRCRHYQSECKRFLHRASAEPSSGRPCIPRPGQPPWLSAIVRCVRLKISMITRPCDEVLTQAIVTCVRLCPSTRIPAHPRHFGQPRNRLGYVVRMWFSNGYLFCVVVPEHRVG